MNCKISYSSRFAKDLKRLAKRYSSIKEDYQRLLETLRKNSLEGVSLGLHLREVRMSASKGKGKSGGTKVITYVIVWSDGADVKLLTIYDKSDRDTITDGELLTILRQNSLL